MGRDAYMYIFTTPKMTFHYCTLSYSYECVSQICTILHLETRNVMWMLVHGVDIILNQTSSWITYACIYPDMSPNWYCRTKSILLSVLEISIMEVKTQCHSQAGSGTIVKLTENSELLFWNISNHLFCYNSSDTQAYESETIIHIIYLNFGIILP